MNRLLNTVNSSRNLKLNQLISPVVITSKICKQNYSSSKSELETFSSDITGSTDTSATTKKQLRAPIVNRKLVNLENVNLKVTPPRESWVDNFDDIDVEEKRGLIQLNPRIFSIFPRLDLIYENVKWQKDINNVEWIEMPHRVELDRMGPRPWPQKGTGRARHRDKRSPIWIMGGWANPPRGPRTFYYHLDHQTRILGLASTLAVKHAQNDIKIIDTLEDFPSDDPKDLEQFLDNRRWGPSTLIVDVNPVFPRNISLASEGVLHVNLMPVMGLNVFSMLKHETLVLTVAALDSIEEKLTHHMIRLDTDKFTHQQKLRDLDYERDPMTELPLD